jgi:hypothetical protein
VRGHIEVVKGRARVALKKRTPRGKTATEARHFFRNTKMGKVIGPERVNNMSESCP